MAKVKISRGNSKLGGIPNISLIPVQDCANCEACKNTCYSLKAWKMYPQTRKAWRGNSQAFRVNMVNAFAEVAMWFAARGNNAPRFFRIHVAGDFLSQDHVDGWTLMAETWPETKFLAFTKRHDLKFGETPKNLQVVLSMFPTMDVPPEHNSHLPIAWLAQDKTGTEETRVPDDAIECGGSCATCAMCWNLEDLKRDVVFHLH